MGNPNNVKPENINSSNIHYFHSIYQTILEENGVIGIYKSITYRNKKNELESLRVDVISDNGLRWIKVKARNEKGINSDLNSNKGNF